MALESFTFTVGKLDAGMAILLGDRAHLIEFPSVLLPPGATAGSIVNIAVHQNYAAEQKRDEAFWALQDDILDHFGVTAPSPPNLQVRNITQTSITLEWPQIQLATAKLRSLDIYRNGQRLAAIPAPLTNTSTKLSGLETDAAYTFQLILRTSAGTFPSKLLRIQTHTMADTSGISVCFGHVEDSLLKENAIVAIQEMGGKWSDKIQIDTTHFVCTSPAMTPSAAAETTGGPSSTFGVEYQRALQLSIPVVQPQWLMACHTEKKMVPIAAYYLGATAPTSAPFSGRPQSMSQVPLSAAAQPPVSSKGVRSSMPAPSRTEGASSPFVNQPIPSSPARFDPTPETAEEEEEVDSAVTLEPVPPAAEKPAPSPIPEPTEEDDEEEPDSTLDSTIDSTLDSDNSHRKSRSGTMNRAFKFPNATPTASPSVDPPSFTLAQAPSGKEHSAKRSVSKFDSVSIGKGDLAKEGVVVEEEKPADEKLAEHKHAPSQSAAVIEVPPPPPVDKDVSLASSTEGTEGEGGAGSGMEEISLN